MKKPKMKWCRKLTMADIRHIKESSDSASVTLRAVRANLAIQKEKGIICWECQSIGRKLGLIPEQGGS